MQVSIYTDGACTKQKVPGLLGGSGIGGYAAIMFVDGVRIAAHYGGHPATTNNRMELMGLIAGMRLIPVLKKLYCQGCGVTDDLWELPGNVAQDVAIPSCVVDGCANYQKKAVAHPVYPNPLIYSDSKYVVDGATSWLEKWKLYGWKTFQKKDVMNRDLWEQVDLHKRIVQPSFQWVKGHSGDYGNEMADQLAVKALQLTAKSKAPWDGALD